MSTSLSTVDVALDAMGGDSAPEIPVEAAVLAARRGVRVAIVGDRARLDPLLQKLGGHALKTLRVEHADEVVEMADKPSAVRTRKDASINVAARLVARGDARAMLSAGNSGAVMASALFEIGRIPGVQRPAIAARLPTRRDETVVLDLGANNEPTAVQLAQFAIMGAAYAKAVLGRARPRVALLANGSEAEKGTDLTRAAHALLQRAEIEYVGYCEGRDIFEGALDVVVTDGFTGNVMLKTVEGFVAAVRDIVEREVRANWRASAGALLMKQVFRGVKDRLDYEKAGAAPLLGLKRRVLVAHGASTVNALVNAISRADALAGTRVIETIEDSIARHAELGLWKS